MLICSALGIKEAGKRDMFEGFYWNYYALCTLGKLVNFSVPYLPYSN